MASTAAGTSPPLSLVARRDAAPAASPVHSPLPMCSRIAAAVRRVAAARAAAALRAAPLDMLFNRARSCRRARRVVTVVHSPSSQACGSGWQNLASDQLIPTPKIFGPCFHS